MKRSVPPLLWAFAAAFVGAPLIAQPPAPEGAPAAPVVAAAPSKLLAEVPFEFYANKVYLNVMVNGHGPYPMAFDTGSPTPVLDRDLAKELEIEPGVPMPINGAGEGSMKGSISGSVKLSIGELNLSGAATAIIPIDSKLGPSSGHRLMGLVGNNICTRYTVVLDYAGHVMRFYDAATYEYVPPAGADPPDPAKSHEARVRIRGHTMIEASVTPREGMEPLKGTYIVDTGARISIALATPFVDKNGLLDGPDKIPTIPAIAGHGIGGLVRHHVGRLASMKLAGFTIANPVVYLSQDKRGVLASPDIAGIIGADILKKFTLVLDYRRHRIIFEPNASLAEPTEFDMSGLWLTAEGEKCDRFVIGDVSAGSPAEAAGVKEGDVLVSIDGKPVGGFTYERIVDLFKQDGREVKLKVKRGEEEREVGLVLKRRA